MSVEPWPPPPQFPPLGRAIPGIAQSAQVGLAKPPCAWFVVRRAHDEEAHHEGGGLIAEALDAGMAQTLMINLAALNHPHGQPPRDGLHGPVSSPGACTLQSTTASVLSYSKGRNRIA